MKKISIIAVMAIVAVLTLSNCDGLSTTQLRTSEDTLSAKFGQMYGYGIAGEIMRSADSSTFDRESFAKGIELVLSADTSDIYYIQGLGYGARLVEMFRQARERDRIEFNTDIIMKEFKKTFLADSIHDAQFIQAEFNTMMKRISREKKENDPVAIQNKKVGEAFINDLVKNDTDVKVTESGLAYKVLAEGEGETFAKNQRIMIKYKGTKIDGEVFDEKEEAVAMSPMSLVVGFREGVTMMKPGSKYMLYIPGDLAYGVDGKGEIGPNETLIFEVETVGLAPERAKSKNKKK